MRSSALFAATGFVFVAACGARSTLHDPVSSSPGSGGEGTGGGATTAASTAATGIIAGPGGGPSGPCNALVSNEPPIELPGSDLALSAHEPIFELLGKTDVLALARREAPNSPAVGSVNLTSTRFDAWSTWPPPPFDPPVNVIASAPGFTFVSSVEPNGTFALGMKPYPMNAPVGCELQASYGITPGAPLGLGALSAHALGTCDDVPISVASAGNGTHFVASDLVISDKTGTPVRGMSVEILSPDGNLLTATNDACASSRLVGDVLATQTGFLFVQSAGDALDCFQTDPPRRLFLRRFDGASEESFVVHDGFDDLVYTRILPRKGGSWIFYRESGASAEVQPPAMAVPFGTDSATGQEFAITDPGVGQVAIGALGGGFVVAIVDTLDPSSATILVRVYSAAGVLTAQSSFSTSGAGFGLDRVAVIGSPSGTSFLVGWTGSSAGGSTKMMMRRFDCIELG
jgi:hypothetical protein